MFNAVYKLPAANDKAANSAEQNKCNLDVECHCGRFGFCELSRQHLHACIKKRSKDWQQVNPNTDVAPRAALRTYHDKRAAKSDDHRPHLRGPTRSPRIGMDRTVIIIGAMKNRAVASGRGKTASAAKYVMFDANTITARNACNPG